MTNRCMQNWITPKINQWKQSGRLAIVAALLFELLTVLWLSFFFLFALETLLPTFITIRLSLANFLALLILTTIFYLFLERQLGLPEVETKTPRWLSVGTWFFGFILIALSLARFTVIGVIVFLIAYLLLWQLLKHFLSLKEEK